jgi:hypothetical protein
LAAQARAVLKTHCYRCHGRDGTSEGGISNILDRDRLIASRRLVPGNPAASRLYRRIAKGEMPPEDESPRPSPEDIAAIKAWIEAGAPAGASTAPAIEFLADAQALSYAAADLRVAPERDRRYYRYFTLTHLYNAGVPADELETCRHALTKLLNNLSWHRTIVRPLPVDPARTVFRIDIRDLLWTEQIWQKVLSAYPHTVLLDAPDAREVRAAADGQLNYVRADWFAATASRPPLYHELLQLPPTEGQLEQQLHIDLRADVAQERVARAGFNGSGVSRNNRLIERHESPHGSFWRSYDFASSSDRGNVFSHPLGPGTAANTFVADGGEVIFSLPNGLHAFLLVDRLGRRLDKAPLTIVSDPRRPDRAVENGISCMSCHARGLIAKADQVRAHVERNRGAFSAEEGAAVLAIYPPEAAMAALFGRDNSRYEKALDEAGVPLAPADQIVALALRYEKELDLPTAAAEVGLRPEELASRLNRSAALARILGPLRVPGGTVQRTIFNEVFGDLAKDLGLPISQGPGEPGNR